MECVDNLKNVEYQQTCPLNMLTVMHMTLEWHSVERRPPPRPTEETLPTDLDIMDANFFQIHPHYLSYTLVVVCILYKTVAENRVDNPPNKNIYKSL